MSQLAKSLIVTTILSAAQLMAGIASLIIYALAGETAVHLGSVYNISFQGDRTFGVTMSPDAVLIFVVLTAMLTLLISLGHLAAQRCRNNGG